jgi:hypothetical protein
VKGNHLNGGFPREIFCTMTKRYLAEEGKKTFACTKLCQKLYLFADIKFIYEDIKQHVTIIIFIEIIAKPRTIISSWNSLQLLSDSDLEWNYKENLSDKKAYVLHKGLMRFLYCFRPVKVIFEQQVTHRF